MADNREKYFRLTAKTLGGLEEVLAGELNTLGAEDVRVSHRAVTFSGSRKVLYCANYYCRTAIKILKPIFEERIRNDIQLYDSIRSIPWSDMLDVKGTFAIDSAIASPLFTHSLYVTQRVKDAIADQFRDKFGTRPSVNTDDPDLRINIHIANDQLITSLDSSGESLHKRGYRLEQGPAPLNEVLAAGLILLSGWKGNTNFTDPMCGSGTLPIEAALIAYNIPPGVYRKAFAFEKWADFDEQLFDQITGAHIENKKIEFLVTGSDISERSVSNAKRNAKNAFLENKIALSRASIEETKPPEGGGIAIINPPYGKRLKTFEIEAFYKRLGDALKKKYAGYEVWVFTANKEALKHLGLRTARRLTLYNGPLECKYHKYEMFSGTRN